MVRKNIQLANGSVIILDMSPKILEKTNKEDDISGKYIAKQKYIYK
jgi:hypothetical protein